MLMSLDVTSKRGGLLVYIKSSLPSRIMPNFKLLNYISGKRSGCLSVFVSHLYKVTIISLTL